MDTQAVERNCHTSYKKFELYLKFNALYRLTLNSLNTFQEVKVLMNRPIRKYGKK